MGDEVSGETPEDRHFSIRQPWRIFVVVVAVMAVGISAGTQINRWFVGDKALFSTVEESLLLAAYFRGGSPDDHAWLSNSDQIVTLSLYYTGDISSEDCAERFSRKSYVGKLYQPDGELSELIETRYWHLISLLRKRPELIEGGGDLETPADPTYTSCRLTVAGQRSARTVVSSFRPKPGFPNWPDKRTIPGEP